MRTTLAQIDSAKAGDINARNQIILDNMGLIKKIANRSFRKRFEDAVQDGIFGVILAIQQYDPLQAGFTTYLGIKVHRAMEERRGTREFTTLDAPLSNKEMTLDSEFVNQKVINVDNIAVEKPDTTWLHEAIETLEPRERLVIDLLYFHGATLEVIGDILDISKQRVDQIHKRALNKLREVLK